MKSVWSVRMIGLCLVLFGGASVSWGFSNVNLNPDYPTRLDDAYPIKKYDLMMQSQVTADVFRRETNGAQFGRVHVVHDLRYGISENAELTMGAASWNATTGGESGGPNQFDKLATEDYYAFRVGGMVRVYRPTNGSGAPHIGVRVNADIPMGRVGGTGLRSSLLSTWQLNSRWWLSTNLWYAVATEARSNLWGEANQPGRMPGNRTSLAGGTFGAVYAFTERHALVADVVVQENYVPPTSGAHNIIFSPEIGYLFLPDPHVQLVVGIGREFLGEPQNAVIRGTFGISFIW